MLPTVPPDDSGSTAYRDFVALKNSGFKSPAGPGRCGWCAFHTPTQGHREGCPMQKVGSE